MLRGEEAYELERIIDHDFKFGVQWFKVSWKGWSELYESTWEPRSELMKDASRLVLKYEREHGLKVDTPVSRKTRRGQ